MSALPNGGRRQLRRSTYSQAGENANLTVPADVAFRESFEVGADGGGRRADESRRRSARRLASASADLLHRSRRKPSSRTRVAAPPAWRSGSPSARSRSTPPPGTDQSTRCLLILGDNCDLWVVCLETGWVGQDRRLRHAALFHTVSVVPDETLSAAGRRDLVALAANMDAGHSQIVAYGTFRTRTGHHS